MDNIPYTQKTFSEVPTEIKTFKLGTVNTEGEESITHCNKGNWKKTENPIKSKRILLTSQEITIKYLQKTGLRTEMTNSIEHQSQGLSKGTPFIKWYNFLPFLLLTNPSTTQRQYLHCG